MKPNHPFSRVGALSILLLACGPAAGQETFDLLQGSTLRDECLFCDRAPILKMIQGTFSLTIIPIADRLTESYRITEIQFQDVDGVYKINGSGQFDARTPGGEAGILNLEVDINGIGGIQLGGGPVDPGPFWPPAFEAQATDKFPEDHPSNVYTLRLIAAPQPKKKPVAYRLISGDFSTGEGSFLIDSCAPPCKRATFTIPVQGTFQLSEIAANPLFSTYRLDAIQIDSGKFERPYTLAGDALFKFGGEVALQQTLQLGCSINGEGPIRLTSGGSVGAGEPFPEIRIDLEQTEPEGFFIIYSLKLAASPADKPASTLFRRGDFNVDGEADVSDAVGILEWLFIGGESPPCLDAADVNGISGHDISDPIYLLLYLFLAGNPPPEPGPQSCGEAPVIEFGCEKYPAC